MRSKVKTGCAIFEERVLYAGGLRHPHEAAKHRDVLLQYTCRPPRAGNFDESLPIFPGKYTYNHSKAARSSYYHGSRRGRVDVVSPKCKFADLTTQQCRPTCRRECLVALSEVHSIPLLVVEHLDEKVRILLQHAQLGLYLAEAAVHLELLPKTCC